MDFADPPPAAARSCHQALREQSGGDLPRVLENHPARTVTTPSRSPSGSTTIRTVTSVSVTSGRYFSRYQKVEIAQIPARVNATAWTASLIHENRSARIRSPRSTPGWVHVGSQGSVRSAHG